MVTTIRKTTTAPAVSTRRRQPLPGEVNITNDPAARAALTDFRAQKVREQDGSAAKRERTAEGGSESILRDRLGVTGKVLVISGQPVLTVSSPRHTTKVDLELLKTAFPEAYAAVVSEVGYNFLQ